MPVKIFLVMAVVCLHLYHWRMMMSLHHLCAAPVDSITSITLCIEDIQWNKCLYFSLVYLEWGEFDQSWSYCVHSVVWEDDRGLITLGWIMIQVLLIMLATWMGSKDISYSFSPFLFCLELSKGIGSYLLTLMSFQPHMTYVPFCFIVERPLGT